MEDIDKYCHIRVRVYMRRRTTSPKLKAEIVICVNGIRRWPSERYSTDNEYGYHNTYGTENDRCSIVEIIVR
jgi:hypothetical protein